MGVTSGKYVTVEIGSSGLTLLAFSERDGQVVIEERRPTSGWRFAQRLPGLGDPEVSISIARDETAVAYSVDFRQPGDLVNRVHASVRSAFSGQFDRWQYVSFYGDTVGGPAAAVALWGGHATVVWGSSCGDGRERSLWEADLGYSSSTFPVGMADIACDVSYVDLQKDSMANEYLAAGGSSGVWFDVRPAHEIFGHLVKIRGSSEMGEGPFLSVTPDGLAVLLWEDRKSGSRQRPGYRYVLSTRGSRPTGPMRMAAPASTAGCGNPRLRGTAPLPRGRIAMMFTQRCRVAGKPRDRISIYNWRVGTEFARPAAVKSLKAGQRLLRPRVETSSSGSELLWWGAKSAKTGRFLGYRWR